MGPSRQSLAQRSAAVRGGETVPGYDRGARGETDDELAKCLCETNTTANYSLVCDTNDHEGANWKQSYVSLVRIRSVTPWLPSHAPSTLALYAATSAIDGRHML